MTKQAPLVGLEVEIGGPVECLGKTFANDAARRAHFLDILRRRLLDPEFRATPGFPKGSDEDILAMSDPPYYTPCPNPFLADFVRLYGTPYDPNELYRREPFAVDTKVGRSDALYKAHSYHTKVPHLAIVPSILHYTRPGDLVLDGFCGSGMTGVAAQFCGTALDPYRRELEEQWRTQGRPLPEWGARRAILNDLSPAATFIAAGYNLPFDVPAFAREARRILDEVEAELGWIYETTHTDGSKSRINFTVWSEIFTCPECASEVNFVAAAMDPETKKIGKIFPCPACGAVLTKNKMERAFETHIDPATGDPRKHSKLVPVLINYTVGRHAYEKVPDSNDTNMIDRIAEFQFAGDIPVSSFPFQDMWEAPRLRARGISRVHHLFFRRTLEVLVRLWRKTMTETSEDMRIPLRFWIDSQFANLSIMNRYRPEISFPYNPMNGAYYVGSALSEANPFVAYRNKSARIVTAFKTAPASRNLSALSTGDCATLPIMSNSVDYIFTDPPFGDNYPYAELNFLAEAWHRVVTDPTPEAIVDRSKENRAAQHTLLDYQRLMQSCFQEYLRVLKPGRWMTVVFSNSKNYVWRAIQEAIGTAGFVVGDVRTLDKKQRSFKQVTSSAVKQDLVISAYKPTETLAARFTLEAADASVAWAFVREHLGNVPVFVGSNGAGEVLAERTAQLLHDRMVAFFVQRGVAVPIAGPDFLVGLSQRFPERDGMYFLSDQVAEYDRRRTTAQQMVQLDMFVNDEATAIRWLRRELGRKPQSFPDLQPRFMQETHTWARHERTVDLRDILEQNVLRYDGTGPVPTQIHSYLSTNYKDLRNLSNEEPELVAKARDRWYVPDPAQQGDLDKLRERALRREFEEYKVGGKGRLKQFRTEAMRAGFKAAFNAQDYATIVSVAGRLPEAVLFEDEILLMYYDVARTRMST